MIDQRTLERLKLEHDADSDVGRLVAAYELLAHTTDTDGNRLARAMFEHQALQRHTKMIEDRKADLERLNHLLLLTLHQIETFAVDKMRPTIPPQKMDSDWLNIRVAASTAIEQAAPYMLEALKGDFLADDVPLAVAFLDELLNLIPHILKGTEQPSTGYWIERLQHLRITMTGMAVQFDSIQRILDSYGAPGGGHIPRRALGQRVLPTLVARLAALLSTMEQQGGGDER